MGGGYFFVPLFFFCLFFLILNMGTGRGEFLSLSAHAIFDLSRVVLSITFFTNDF